MAATRPLRGDDACKRQSASCRATPLLYTRTECAGRPARLCVTNALHSGGAYAALRMRDMAARDGRGWQAAGRKGRSYRCRRQDAQHVAAIGMCEEAESVPPPQRKIIPSIWTPFTLPSNSGTIWSCGASLSPWAVPGNAVSWRRRATRHEKFGVRSAVPSITAKRQCPDLIFVKPRFEAYKAVSLQVRDIFAEHTHLIEEALRMLARPFRQTKAVPTNENSHLCTRR
jgi:hypothetical protein